MRISATRTQRMFGRAIPIHGIAGDQQAALVGHGCLKPGMAKSTYGTGAFLVMNMGERRRVRANRLLATIGYKPGTPSRTRSKARSSPPAPRCNGCATA